jgi:hypothetical protein
MTDLDLARAIFPAHDVNLEYMMDGRPSWGWRKKPADKHYTVWKFDPEGEHFADVLAWLLSNHEASVGGEDVTVYAGNQRYEYTPHDCAPAGIRRAVHEAALRVLEAQ